MEGACFLHIGFQKDPTQDELDWADALLAKPELQGLPVIVTTHDYIDGSGRCVTGRRIWNEFVNNNPMVFMVLNGHTHTEYAVVNHNAENRPVYQMLSDYQDRPNAGNGLMRLVTIDPAAGAAKRDQQGLSESLNNRNHNLTTSCFFPDAANLV